MEYDQTKEKEVVDGVYLLNESPKGSARVVVLVAGRKYHTFPQINSSEIAMRGLKKPEPSEMEDLRNSDRTATWLSTQARRGPRERAAIDSFFLED